MTWSANFRFDLTDGLRVRIRVNEADGEKGRDKTACQSSHPSRPCLNHVIDSNTAEITDSLSRLPVSPIMMYLKRYAYAMANWSCINLFWPF